MPLRRPDGAALLVAGFSAPNAPASDASAVHTLAQIGEALLSTGAAWQIRRLTAVAGERYAADRATLKHHFDDLAAEPLRAAIVVMFGSILDVGGTPALVTGAQAREYPEDATLPLAWIRERLLAAKADQLIVVVSARGEGSATDWLGALGTYRAQHVIAIDAPGGDDGHPVIDALLTGLCGDALDPRTGTVTVASLSDHLGQLAPRAVMQASAASETIAQPPPFAGFWDVRRSQLAHRTHRARSAGDLDDLTGTVLPGRFRIDRVLARGTFGTVYRARQLAVERDVAIKVLHANIDPSSEDGRLFVHEIRSVGRIKHSNVVPIYQADITHDGRLFFAMEMLDGRDLQQLGADGVLPIERAIELMRQLLAGLGAAHDAGLVHADVKPANAIVVPLKPAIDPARGGELARGSASMAVPADAAAAAGEQAEAAERLVLVDFGLARLRAPDRATESAGGTPAYMAPEQLHEGRVDARSDLYSAALVLVFLLTGWRRTNIHMLAPPLDSIADAQLRAVLARALQRDPARRFQSARALLGALPGHAAPTPGPATQPSPVLPFRHLAPLTELDRGRLHGRETDLALLTEHVLFRRSVVYTAPSGTGKTSMLRAGLVPRLEALGIPAIYHRCRGKPVGAIAEAIMEGTATIAEAVERWHQHHHSKLVLVLDQLESAVTDPEFLPSVLGFDRWPAGADVAVVLSIREDYLARLVERTQELEPGMPIVRLPPLSRAGARAAISAPLAEARLAIEPELLDALLDDLERAAAAIGPEMGWAGDAAAVYPPHLQLACTVMYEHLGPGEATLTLAHYRRLGGFDAIVGEHLERVLDTELADGRDVIARDLFVALVTTGQERAIRPEEELLAIAGAKHGRPQVAAVLETLRSRGLLVRVRGTEEPSWELVHDSLVPRVLAWLDARDLARRRAIELVRYHLRRSRPDEPSLLDRTELGELRAHAGAIAELDEEWRQRGPAESGAWTPGKLVEHSRRALRRRRAFFATTLVAALALGGASTYSSCARSAAARREHLLLSANIGEVRLVIEAFDWDPAAQRATPAAPALGWRWTVRDADDQPIPDQWIRRRAPLWAGLAVVEELDVRGGPALLVVERDGCAPSVVPIRFPGYAPDHERQDLKLRVPTCAVTRAGVIEVPAGPFVYGGVGDPPAPGLLQLPEDKRREEAVELPAFSIDRTEVTNAAFAVFAAMSKATGIPPRKYLTTPDVGHAAGPRNPVSTVTWHEARQYCRFLGKDLPTSKQWVKAMRGGLKLADGSVNPMPRRNVPWGTWRTPVPARLQLGGTSEVATSGDVSPYGVHDLAGNVCEWTQSPAEDGGWQVRGGAWGDTTADTLLDFMASENVRDENLKHYGLGFRCVLVE